MKYRISVVFMEGYIFMGEDEFDTYEDALSLMDRLEFHNPNLRFEIETDKENQ